jgi:hypothetical protein
VVYEIAFAAPTSSTIGAFAADLEQRCAPGAPPLFGAVRYHSSRADLRPFPPPPTTQTPSDLNGDAWPDLVWQNYVDGRLAVWLLNGTAVSESTSLLPGQLQDPSWHIVGGGDANGDGRMDLYWQHESTRALAVWYMYETSRVGGEMLSPQGSSDPLWRVRTVADLDRDGSPDLIWRHDGTGDVAAWFMSGSRLRSSEMLSPSRVSDLDWDIVGAGDVDGDGYPDLLWHHSVTGQVAVWIMRRQQMSAGVFMSPDRLADTNWILRGLADLDGNGSLDLIWENAVTMQVGTWLMQGLRLLEGRLFTGASMPGADWHIAAPK